MPDLLRPSDQGGSSGVGPKVEVGYSLDSYANLAVSCEGTAGSGSGKVDAQGFGDVDKRSSQFPECGPKLASERGGGGDDNRFCGNKARLNLVLDKVAEVLRGFCKVRRDVVSSAKRKALDVIDVDKGPHEGAC